MDRSVEGNSYRVMQQGGSNYNTNTAYGRSNDISMVDRNIQKKV